MLEVTLFNVIVQHQQRARLGFFCVQILGRRKITDAFELFVHVITDAFELLIHVITELFA